MGEELLYFTETAVSSLWSRVSEHLDWYYQASGAPPRPIGVDRVEGHTQLRAVDVAGCLRLGTGTDAENAIAVYNALSQLRPREAADERFWVHLCHGEAAGYVRQRWLANRPEDCDDAVQQVRNHFFAKGNRALIRDNALSRLWWLGYIANEVAADAPRLFLDILMHRQDIRSALIERPFLSMNHKVLREIYAVMRDHWEQDGSSSKLFIREVFRDWMVRLNRRGGVILLDAVPDGTLADLLRKEASESLSEMGHGSTS